MQITPSPKWTELISKAEELKFGWYVEWLLEWLRVDWCVCRTDMWIRLVEEEEIDVEVHSPHSQFVNLISLACRL